LSIRVLHGTIQDMDTQIQIVRTRIAPSPSGNLHVGTAHTALFNYLFAKHHNGQFILRIDDSDQTRSHKEFETNIVESLHWLGITWVEGPDIGGPYGPYRQSERMDRYQKYIAKLIQENKAYYCYCTPEELDHERKEQEKNKIATKYSGRCSQLTEGQKNVFIKNGRKPAVRFRTPNKRVTFVDSVDTNLFGDFIISRRDGSTLLNLAATIDDVEMRITHAIRGEDFLNLVPRQILLFEALGHPPPVFAHLSFLYAPDRTKLSKRHGATSVTEYRDMGILSEAMVNYLATLGWAIPQGVIEEHKQKGIPEELLETKDIIKYFNIEDVKSSAPIFDIEKLKWMNGLYLRKLANKQLFDYVKSFLPENVNKDLVNQLLPLAKERIKTLQEFKHYLKPFVNYVTFELEEKYKNLLPEFNQWLSTETNWTTQNLEKKAKEIVINKQLPMRDAFMALRLATTGEKVGLPLFQTWEILGKNTIMERLHKSL